MLKLPHIIISPKLTWVTWKELKVPSYSLVKKIGPIHLIVNSTHTLSEHNSRKKDKYKRYPKMCDVIYECAL